MTDPFVAEIRIFGFPFAPTGWAACNGQILPLAQNTALFSLLGTRFGGDGQRNFGLPNLVGRVPMQAGTGPGLSPRELGEAGGAATVALTTDQMPPHTHTMRGSVEDGTQGTLTNNVVLGTSVGASLYRDSGGAQMASAAVTSSGGGQPHNNLQPYLAVNFCIALQGVFPPRSS